MIIVVVTQYQSAVSLNIYEHMCEYQEDVAGSLLHKFDTLLG